MGPGLPKVVPSARLSGHVGIVSPVFTEALGKGLVAHREDVSCWLWMISRIPDSVPRPAAWGGAILAVSAALPLSPTGVSFIGIARQAFAIDPLQGLVTILGFGSPYLFGIATALLGAFGVAHDWIRSCVRITVSLMAGQLLLVSALLVRHKMGLHAEGLLGFAIVGTVYLLYFSARSRAEGTGEGPPMRFVVRWGALLVFGVGTWMRLQWVDDVAFGPAVDLASLAAVVMLWVMRPGASPEIAGHRSSEDSVD